MKAKEYPNNGIVVEGLVSIISSNEDVCACVLSKISDYFSLISKSGCPKNCKYILEDGKEKKFFICDVIT